MTSYQSPSEAVTTEEAITNPEVIDELIEMSKDINHVEVIENVINSVSQEGTAMENHPSEGGYLWKFSYGSVEVFVQLTGTSGEDTITVWSSVLKLPAKDEPKLMRQLLEMNCSSTFEARFGIIENQVVVISARQLEELSAGEVSRLITIVATIADNNNESLKAEFN
ncbi:MAG: YbjN domain-containing protein [Scytonematopsis contorta HA4267-MV1]|jgi:hypothetical protein|nr:YbjN domain-containing protein [Scytonematopsis contorta HA4267-MV1]